MACQNPTERYGTYGPGDMPHIRRMLNVRDLGGYAVAGGRRVKKGLLVRGSRLAGLSEDEFAAVAALRPAAILDLRAATEAASSPDPQIPGSEYLRVGGMYFPGTLTEVDFSPQQMKEYFGAGPDGGLSTPESVRAGAAKMLPLYLGMPFGNPGFRALFDLLLTGKTPVYFHCSAGKDRTGIAALLVLLVLGASEEDTAFDYALTNVYRSELIDLELADHAEALAADPSLELSVRMLQGVDPAMPGRVMAAICERYGTLGRYFGEEFGLGAAEIAHLRELYTEEAALAGGAL